MLSSDFYAAYDHYPVPGPHQRCWRHLLADSHELLERHPHDAILRAWADQVHGVYARARRCVATAEPDPAAPAVRQREQRACEAALLALCVPFLDADTAVVPQAVLGRRIQKYLPELCTCVAEPEVESTNNAAERAIRPVVVQRTSSGGLSETRSPTGTTIFCTLATLFGTRRARGLDPLVACRQMLRAHAAAASV